ncbi:hypothetical protein [Chitiniphilus eburneus]
MGALRVLVHPVLAGRRELLRSLQTATGMVVRRRRGVLYLAEC